MMELPTFDRDISLDKLPMFKQSRELREQRVRKSILQV
jgi:hypothetical protein